MDKIRYMCLVLLFFLISSCTDYGRSCTLHFIAVDEHGEPISGLLLELKPSTYVSPVQSSYKETTDEYGIATLEYLQKWSNRSKPPEVEWTLSSIKTPIIMGENNEEYFIIKKTTSEISVQIVTKQEFETLKNKLRSKKSK